MDWNGVSDGKEGRPRCNEGIYDEVERTGTRTTMLSYIDGCDYDFF